MAWIYQPAFPGNMEAGLPPTEARWGYMDQNGNGTFIPATGQYANPNNYPDITPILGTNYFTTSNGQTVSGVYGAGGSFSTTPADPAAAQAAKALDLQKGNAQAQANLSRGQSFFDQLKDFTIDNGAFQVSALPFAVSGAQSLAGMISSTAPAAAPVVESSFNALPEAVGGWSTTGGIGGVGGSGLTQAEMDVLTANAATDVSTGVAGPGGAITGTSAMGMGPGPALTGIDAATGALKALPGATTPIPGISPRVGIPIPGGSPSGTGSTGGTGTSGGTGSGTSGGGGFNLGSLGGLSALIPGLAMGASIAAKPKFDTTKLSDIAGQLSGPGSLGALAGDTARSLIPSVSTGVLPEGAQTEVNNAVNDAKQSIKSHYATMGLTGSTMEGQELAAADARGQAMQFDMANKLTATGLTAAGVSTSDLSASALIYDEILKTQLSQDEALQAALANFASASAIGVGLASQGKTDTSGATGLTGALSSIGSGISSGWNSLLQSLGIGSGGTTDPGVAAEAAATDTGITGSAAGDLMAGIQPL